MPKANNRALSLIAIVLLPCAALAFLLNPNAEARSGSEPQIRGAIEMRSASGKITSVSRSSFTLRVLQSDQKNPGGRFLPGQQASEVLTFVIDQNTAIDGKLRVGATADVAYRTDSSGNNVAVSVRVTPES